MQRNVYLYILGMWLVSYLIRVLPLTLIRREITNVTVRSFLYYVPYVTLAVMTFPAILSAPGSAGACSRCRCCAARWCSWRNSSFRTMPLLREGFLLQFRFRDVIMKRRTACFGGGFLMKKQLSMFLVLALLTVLYGGAFADTLQLPGSLTTIEAESFSDNPALDEVSVAWGTERIESRAFASSGVKKIYIPATVTAIADDAFAGTSVTICSAADAYARQYADAHGLAWEDSGNHDRKSAVSQLVDYSAKFRGPECEPLAMLDRWMWSLRQP